MTSLEKPQIQCRKLTDKHTTESLHVLSDLIAMTIGPHGGIKILGNACGGHLSLTTLSSRLLNTLTPASPLVKLILTAAHQQVCSYGDAGLFTASFTLNLLVNGLRTQIDRKFLMKSNAALLCLSLDSLQSADFPCRRLVEISDVESWTCVACTMLLAKPLCGLDQDEAHLIAQLLLEAFIIKLPIAHSGQSQMGTLDEGIHILGVQGQSSNQSFCCQGLLLELNNLSEVKDWLRKHNLRDKPVSVFKTLVVNISMAGDPDNFLDIIFEESSLESLEESFLIYIEDYCSQMSTLDIQIVFCQKVIHPRIKELLRDKGILAIDRLGSEHCPRVLTLTGGYPISSFSSPITADQVGSVDNISIVDIGKKAFFHMTQTSAIMVTLVLSAYMDEQLEELKALSKNVLVVFDHFLRNPLVLFGGGCWQFCLANILRKKVKLEHKNLCQELQCSSHQLLEACEYFCRSLEQSSRIQPSGLKSYTHSTIGHFWAVDKQLADLEACHKPCMCGTVKCQLTELNPLPEEYFTLDDRKLRLSEDGNATLVVTGNSMSANDKPFEKPLLIDCFVSWRNSLETSVRMANMALGTNQFIFESVH